MEFSCELISDDVSYYHFAQNVYYTHSIGIFSACHTRLLNDV